MKTNKLTALLVCVFCIICLYSFTATAAESKGADSKPASKGEEVPFNPLGFNNDNPSLGALQILSEQSGILWKRPVFGPDGKTPTEIHYSYRDGYRSVFFMSMLGKVNKVQSYYPKKQGEKLYFEVEYATDSVFVHKWKICRPNGSVQESFERLPDGVERKDQFRDNDTLACQITTNPDGSQTTVKFGEDGKLEIAKENIEAKPNEVTYVPRKNPEALDFTVKIHRVGVKILDWTYCNPDGTVSHEAKVDKDGGIVFTVYAPNGKVSYKQGWFPTSEDHLRKYYSLVLIEEYDLDKSVVLNQLMFEKGRFRGALNYNVETKLPARSLTFAPQVGGWTQAQYDPDGSINPHSVRAIPSAYLPSVLTTFIARQSSAIIPGSNHVGGAIYRLTGIPYSNKKLEGEFFLEPLFVK